MFASENIRFGKRIADKTHTVITNPSKIEKFISSNSFSLNDFMSLSNS